MWSLSLSLSAGWKRKMCLFSRKYRIQWRRSNSERSSSTWVSKSQFNDRFESISLWLLVNLVIWRSLVLILTSHNLNCNLARIHEYFHAECRIDQVGYIRIHVSLQFNIQFLTFTIIIVITIFLMPISPLLGFPAHHPQFKDCQLGNGPPALRPPSVDFQFTGGENESETEPARLGEFSLPPVIGMLIARAAHNDFESESGIPFYGMIWSSVREW